MKNLFDKQYEKLAEAYEKTLYRCLNPVLEVRIGEVNMDVDNFITINKYDKFCILTAYNPASKILTLKENQQSQAQLVEELEREGFTYRPGVNCDPEGEFPEESSCWVMGMTQQEGALFSKRWGQNALVYYQLYRMPELIWV